MGPRMPTYRDVLVIDLATAPLADVAAFLEPAESELRKPPSNYTKAESIAKWREDDYADDLKRAALDLDLARISGVGLATPRFTMTRLAKDEGQERALLEYVAEAIDVQTCLVSYNGATFDWPMLMRRAAYLSVPFPTINCDRFRSPHCDVLAKLSLNDKAWSKSLGWYVRRHGWTDLSKPLSGEQEARVFQTQQWDELSASLAHDTTATARLASWLGLIDLPESLRFQPTDAAVTA